MLINKQKIVAHCDICGFEIIMHDITIPKGGLGLIPSPPDYWITFGDYLICGQHNSITIKAETGKETIIEDNRGRRLL